MLSPASVELSVTSPRHMENNGQRADFTGAPELVQPPSGTWREALHTTGRVHPFQEEQGIEVTRGTGPDLEQIEICSEMSG